MNEISGKVVTKESGFGIPGLLVVVFDYDPGTGPEELVRPQGTSGAAPAARNQGVHGDRLGSVVTDGTGAFALTYEDEAFRVRNPQERRPDLCLTVLAPEDVDSSGNSHVLFVSPTVRQNAGRTEQYLIRLTADQLTKAGVVAPHARGPDRGMVHASSLTQRQPACPESGHGERDARLVVADTADRARVDRVKHCYLGGSRPPCAVAATPGPGR